jgi:hypothetical protein
MIDDSRGGITPNAQQPRFSGNGKLIRGWFFASPR